MSLIENSCILDDSELLLINGGNWRDKTIKVLHVAALGAGTAAGAVFGPVTAFGGGCAAEAIWQGVGLP